MSNATLGTIRDTGGLKDVRSDVDPAFRFFTEDLFVQEHATIMKTRDVSTAGVMIWGNSSYGVWGTDWGTSASLPARVIVRVLNPNNIWKESLRTDTFEDTTNTTATWDTTNFRWTFTAGQIIQTSEIYLDQTTITSATLTIDSSRITTPANLTYELSADGGANWESVTLGTKHTFTSTGIDLRLKVTASGAATIDVDDSNDVSIPIEVSYNQ